MAKFVQIIEVETDQMDEIMKLDDEWKQATAGKRTATRALVCEDRDHRGRYFIIVEFPSPDAAKKNDELPETQEFAQKQMKFAKGEPTFHNLDVVQEDIL